MTWLIVLFFAWVLICFQRPLCKLIRLQRFAAATGRKAERCRESMWGLLARVLAYPPIADALINLAKRTPYSHLPSNDDPGYMERYWLFNPYDDHANKMRYSWCPFSIRVQWIKREDADRHLHDHPRNSRTIVLKGGYLEKRMNPNFGKTGRLTPADELRFKYHFRKPGQTATLRVGDFHRIVQVPDGGSWSLFITGRYLQLWGFLVDGHKVPSRRYFAKMFSRTLDDLEV